MYGDIWANSQCHCAHKTRERLASRVPSKLLLVTNATAKPFRCLSFFCKLTPALSVSVSAMTFPVSVSSCDAFQFVYTAASLLVGNHVCILSPDLVHNHPNHILCS